MILLLQTLRTRAWSNPTPTLICNLSWCLPDQRPEAETRASPGGQEFREGSLQTIELKRGRETGRTGPERNLKTSQVSPPQKSQGEYSFLCKKPQSCLSISCVSPSFHSSSFCLSSLVTSPAFYLYHQNHTAFLIS